MSSEKIPAFGGKGYQSMRNNDFNPEGAIAEVIDNSIQAESKNIKIKIFQSIPQGKQNQGSTRLYSETMVLGWM